MLVPAFAIILLFQLAGEIVSRGLHLPLPGPLLGMMGMVVALAAFPKIGDIVTPVAQGILRYLALMFVPIGVGIVANLQVIEAHWLAILASVFLSTIIAIVVGCYAFIAVDRMISKKTGAGADE